MKNGSWRLYYTVTDGDGYRLIVRHCDEVALDVFIKRPDGQQERVMVAARDGTGRVWTVKGGFIKQ